MRIALVIPKFDAGGAERVMSIMAQCLSENHEVHLVFHVVHQPFYSIPNRVTVHYIDSVRPHTRFFTKLCAYLGGLLRLRILLKKIRPHVIVSFNEYRYDQIVIMAKAFLRIPLVVSDRSDPLRYRGLKRLARSAVYSSADAIVVQTEYARQYYERRFARKRISLIRNPVSCTASYESLREPLILSVGRLKPEKGHAYLIRAFASLDLVGWRLAVVGDGLLAHELKDLAERLGVADKVVFPGVVKDIGSYLQRASIFVLPSLREGFPNALVEAMAAGIPCIAFNCNVGLRELVENGSNGFLVEPRKIEALTEKIGRLVEDRSLREVMGEKARAVAKRLADSSSIQKWETLLQSLCGSPC